VFRANIDTYTQNNYENNKIWLTDEEGKINWDATIGLTKDRHNKMPHPIIEHYNSNQITLSDYLLNIL